MDFRLLFVINNTINQDMRLTIQETNIQYGF